MSKSLCVSQFVWIHVYTETDPKQFHNIRNFMINVRKGPCLIMEPVKITYVARKGPCLIMEPVKITYVACSKSIANFEFPRVTYIRFFVTLCWYLYPSLMATSSPILNVQLIFDGHFARACFGSFSIFASLVSGTRKVTGGPDLGNTVAAATLLCCFWPKIRAQATMCKQWRYHGAKANRCFSTNQDVSGRLLRTNCV